MGHEADIKLLKIQQRFSAARTPAELTDMLPEATPMDGGLFFKPEICRDGAEVYRFDERLWKKLPLWSWSRMFALTAPDGQGVDMCVGAQGSARWAMSDVGSVASGPTATAATTAGATRFDEDEIDWGADDDLEEC